LRVGIPVPGNDVVRRLEGGLRVCATRRRQRVRSGGTAIKALIPVHSCLSFILFGWWGEQCIRRQQFTVGFFDARGLCTACVLNESSYLWNDFGMSVRPAGTYRQFVVLSRGNCGRCRARRITCGGLRLPGPRGGCARRRLQKTRVRRVVSKSGEVLGRVSLVAHQFTDAPCCLCATVCCVSHLFNSASADNTLEKSL